MKLLFVLFLGVFGKDVRRSVNTIDCPGRCWEVDMWGECVPDAGKIQLTCGTVGMINVVLDSCLFTPDNADYTQDYYVFFGATRNASATNCFRQISNDSDDIEFDLTYKQATDCGWEWASDSQAETITFSDSITASDNVNKITEQGVTVEISRFPDEIDLSCTFDDSLTLETNFVANQSTITQTATNTSSATLDAGFDMNLKNSTDNDVSDFTVGEEINAHITYSIGASGFTAEDLPFGFYTTYCYVENTADTTQFLYIIGSHNSSAITAHASDSLTRSDPKCTMDSSPLNLNVDTVYEENSLTSTNTDWSTTEYTLTFDAFKFENSGSMKISCTVKICIESECDTNSARSSC